MTHDDDTAWLRDHWLGHRRLTRTTVLAFPERDLLEYAAPGMRPFAAMVHEVASLTGPLVDGVVERSWTWPRDRGPVPDSKDGVLALLDAATERIERAWPSVTAARLREVDTPIPRRTETVLATLLYFIDNEIHHRGQGYVYLRSLGIEPPPFYRR